MIAVILTKSTDKSTFVRMRNNMMNVYSPLRSALEQSYRSSTGSLRKTLGSVYDSLTST